MLVPHGGREECEIVHTFINFLRNRVASERFSNKPVRLMVMVCG